jgi:hypothetical protein
MAMTESSVRPSFGSFQRAAHVIFDADQLVLGKTTVFLKRTNRPLHFGYEVFMAWFGMGSRSHRASSKRVRRFEPADRMVVSAFADLQQARYLKCGLFPEISKSAVEQFEREAWKRLIDCLVKLPPLPSDY